MSFNGSGVFAINSAGQPTVATTLITAAAHNALTADLATGLSTCITKDGQTTITADIPFNNNKITGLKLATLRTDAASLATIQDGTGVYVATVGGTADVITLTPSPAITAYVAGQTFRFLASGVNTGAVTVAISGLTAKAITRDGAVALIAGNILSGSLVQITYDGTRFILVAASVPGAATSWTPSVGGNATYTQQLGSYQRIGRMVFFNCILQINAIGTGSTSVISGLPFTAINDSAVAIGSLGSAALSVVSAQAYVLGAQSSIQVVGRTVAAASDGVLAVFGNGTYINVSGSYYAT